MARRRHAPVPVALAVLVAVARFSAAQTSTTSVLAVEKLDVNTALTLLRSLVTPQRLAVVGDYAVSVTDSPATVRLAKEVLQLAEHPDNLQESVHMLVVADGSVIASVRLPTVSPKAAITALRMQVGIARLASCEALSSITMRDTPDQVDAALGILRALEQSHEPKP